jgi:hypothetical protein
VIADPALRAARAPLVPSVRGGAFGSEAPSSISGSSNSADANNSVGIKPESAGARGTGVLETDEVVEADEGAGASGPRSRSAPCASKSSSESNGPFAGRVGGDAVVDAGVDVEGEGRAPPACDAVPFNPKGSSTGRSAKGSKAGREAASIVFEPDLRRSILNVSCSADAEVPRRWLTHRRVRPGFVTSVTVRGLPVTVPTLQKSDERSSILPRYPVQDGQLPTL